MSSEDDDFVAVGDHVVEGASFGQGFFGFSRVELDRQFGQRVVVLAAAVACVEGELPPKT